MRRIAIVGAGYMANQHAKAFMAIPGVEIVGIVGRSRDRARSLAVECQTKAFESISALYANERPDAVIVAVNELSIYDAALACFEHSWLCLMEKPVGIDLVEAEAILTAAKTRNADVYVALNRRSYGATRHALAELATDASPRLISVLDQQDMNAARASGQPERVVQNYMFANSIHLVDYFRIFGRGEVVSIIPVVNWTPENPGYVVAGIKFSSGDCGIYQAVWNGPGPWSATVTNARLRLELRPLERLGIQRLNERRLTEVLADPVDEQFKPGLRHQAEQLIALLDGRPSDLATLAEAIHSMRLTGALYGLRSS